MSFLGQPMMQLLIISLTFYQSLSTEVVVPEIVKMRELHALVAGKIKDEYVKYKDINITFKVEHEIVTFPITISDDIFQATLVLSDHFPEDKLFVTNAHVQIFIDNSRKVLKGKFETFLNIPPNVQYCDVVKNGKLIEFTVNIKYHCQKYTGDNCMFEESDHPKLMTDYHYGLMCRDEQDCDLDQKCEKSHCFNNGECFLLHSTGQKICQCYDDYAGPNCNIEMQSVLDTENYQRLQIDLIQVAKRENCEECKGKESCTEYEERYVVCNCDEKSSTGRLCEFQCTTPCQNGYCSYDPYLKTYFCTADDGSKIYQTPEAEESSTTEEYQPDSTDSQ